MKFSKYLAAAAMAALTGAAHAALVDRGGGMIYDTTLNITWLSDFDYARTSGFDADGQMDWTTANGWANGLAYGGFDDWRLPTALNADGSGPCGPGVDCSGSEMGHLFYNNWGATAGSDFSTGANAASLALFSNVRSFLYWSGTEYAPNSDFAWNFVNFGGGQSFDPKGSEFFAVAVRDGDVTAAVPEPQTLALVLLAIGAAALTRRKRPA